MGGGRGGKNKGLLEGEKKARQGREEDRMDGRQGACRPWQGVERGVPARAGSGQGEDAIPRASQAGKL